MYFKSPNDNFIKWIISGLKHYSVDKNMFKPDTL